MAETLAALGTERAWLVHGQGLDELTVAGENQVVCARPTAPSTAFTLTPEEAGLAPRPIAAIQGGDPAANAAALLALLQGARGAYRDTVLLNAAAGLVVAGRARTMQDGVPRAAASLDAGRAMAALEELRRATA